MGMTLGSLFDGSGGFPLAGMINGIQPIWASEIEPYPMRVTEARLPNMKQLGSVTEIDGGEIEPVDIITFGSPCQDLSVAGAQKGIHEGERSSLFFEAIRIIKEMRARDRENTGPNDHIRPRFAVWENVPGAFSSNKGQDFRAVLQAFCEVCDPDAHVPEPTKGKWGKAGCIVGDGYSVAWRVYDAQYWGVPQRRKRIYLIADFASERAGEILFEREGLCGDSAEGGESWQGIAPHPQGGSVADDCEGAVPYTLKVRTGCAVDSAGKAAGKGALIQEDKAMTLSTVQDQYLFQPVATEAGGFKANQGAKAGNIGWQDERACTLNAGRAGLEPTVCYMEQPVVFDGSNITSPINQSKPQPGDPCHTLSTDSRNYAVYCLQGNGIDRADTAGCNGKGWREDVCYTLNTLDRPAVAFQTYQKVSGPLMANSHPGSYTGQDAFNDMLVAGAEPVAFDRAAFNQGQNGLYSPQFYEDGTNPTLMARGPSGVAYGVDARNATEYPKMTGALQADACHNLNSNNVVRVHYIVRRLTPTECCRLQGFPDWWEDGVEGSDSSRYKMWGNGIALPCAVDVLQRISKTMNNPE